MIIGSNDRLLRLALILALAVVATVNVAAQTVVSGRVLEQGSGEPLVGASVIVRNAEGKIRKYATTGSDGKFRMELPDVKGMVLDVSMISYGKRRVALEGAPMPVLVELEPAAMQLKEVAVKADRIREQGDTITYSVGLFAQTQDRSIGDVLKRMPGIDVSKNGQIKYQGEEINKFYIEGSDLLGGKYGVATNGINHDDVGAVEVMENHQPMQVLSGISFSEKAAINLKLKNRSKATWNVHGEGGVGYGWNPDGCVWDGNLFAMAVMPSFQNMTTIKSNNIGNDLRLQTTDFFSSGRGTSLSGYVGLSLPQAPSLERKRTLFNRSVLMSANNLWKLRDGDFKAQIDYAYNRVASQAGNVTTYFLENGDRIIAENRSGVERSHSLAAKFIYEKNAKTAFINNTLQADLSWDNVGLEVTGSLPNSQHASLPDYYVANRFKMIKRFKGKHLVTFGSVNEWESLPQTLRVGISDNRLRQQISDHAFYTHESAAYAFAVNGVTVGLEGGLKGYVRGMSSELDGVPALTEIGDVANVVNTNYLTLYATPKLEYWLRRVNFSLTLPLSFASYRFDKAIADCSEVYFSPSLSFNWKPNNRFSLRLRGGTGRSPMNLNMIHPGFMMADYRTFLRGVESFHVSSSHNVSASFSYKHTRKGLFADAMFMQSWSSTPFTMEQQLFGDYIAYTYVDATNRGNSFMASGNIGKTLDFVGGSANVRGMYSRRESYLLSNGNGIESVGATWTLGVKVNGQPLRWLSFDYSFDYSSSRLTMNGLQNDWLGSMQNELLVNVMPHRQWEWHVSGEHYRNELSSRDFKNAVLIDTKLVFKPGKKLEFSMSLNNILDKRRYNYTSYSQLSSFESQRWLRGREILFSITLRK